MIGLIGCAESTHTYVRLIHYVGMKKHMIYCVVLRTYVYTEKFKKEIFFESRHRISTYFTYSSVSNTRPVWNKRPGRTFV